MKLNPKLIPAIKSSLVLNTTYLGTPDINSVVRSGNVVEIILRAPVISNIPNNDIIATLPYKPSNESTDAAGIGGRYNIESFSWFFLNNSGVIKSGRGFTTSKDKYIHIHFTYITGDA